MKTENKPKIIFAKQGDCAEFRALKAEIERQKAKKNAQPPKISKAKPKKYTDEKKIAIFKSFRGIQYFIARLSSVEQAKILKELAELHKDKFNGDINHFRAFLKTKLKEEL